MVGQLKSSNKYFAWFSALPTKLSSRSGLGYREVRPASGSFTVVIYRLIKYATFF